MKRLVLVSCGQQKRSQRARAKDLYTSNLFRYARLYAETYGHYWAILSAEHGWLSPETVVAPYEKTLIGASLNDQLLFRNKFEIGWSTFLRQHRGLHLTKGGVNSKTGKAIFVQVKDLEIVVLAGQAYEAQLVRLPSEIVTYPLRGMQIGQRVSWLKRQCEAAGVSICSAT